MLCELRVENLVLIERAELALGPGLNVLTGETGAGKTMLAHALDLLMGGRPRSGIVRPGAEEAYVEGVFSLAAPLVEQLREQLGEEPWWPAEAQELVLARRVLRDGRTRAYVNGRSAPVAALRDLGARVLSFYGQHEHRKLVLGAAQREILDLACGEAHAATLQACAACHRSVRTLESELERLDQLAAGTEAELELLEHEIAEIEAAAPSEQEHLEALALRDRLRAADELRLAAANAIQALEPGDGEGTGAAHAAARASDALTGIGGVDPELDALAERCRAGAIELQDIAASLSSRLEALDADEQTLESVEARLALLERLMRKHGGSIAAVLDHAERSRARRAELIEARSGSEEAKERLSVERAVLEGHVERLRAQRTRTARRLQKSVREELEALAMADATFEIALTQTEPKASGGDEVQFTIAPNPGVAPASLREIASGGELSRVMLALVTAGEPSASNPGGATASSGATIVFDEIDAGIGGQTARAVGERLRALAAARQVLCITHLPQIASLAQRHFQVVKDSSSKPTVTRIVQLEQADVVGELVRMLGADEQDAGALEHARELLAAA
jgi:DNA repair protein RecN (Recombination protein N)